MPTQNPGPIKNVQSWMATSDRPTVVRVAGSVTASEDRIATLAADGLTNREIAQRQFVTVKAVEWHLSNVYRKLDIASRGELPQMIA